MAPEASYQIRGGIYAAVRCCPHQRVAQIRTFELKGNYFTYPRLLTAVFWGLGDMAVRGPKLAFKICRHKLAGLKLPALPYLSRARAVRRLQRDRAHIAQLGWALVSALSGLGANWQW